MFSENYAASSRARLRPAFTIFILLRAAPRRALRLPPSRDVLLNCELDAGSLTHWPYIVELGGEMGEASNDCCRYGGGENGGPHGDLHQVVRSLGCGDLISLQHLL